MADTRASRVSKAQQGAFQGLTYRIRFALSRVEVLALFPLLALSASWFGFEDLALVTAVSLSALLAIGGIGARIGDGIKCHEIPDLDGRSALCSMLDTISGLSGRDTACLLVQVDDWPILQERWGHDTTEQVAARIEERLQTALRTGDLLTRLGDSRFGIVLSALPSARLSLRDTIASRLAAAIAEPLPMRGAALRLTASIGHSTLIQHGVDPAETTFKAAEAALAEAVLNGPNAIRAFAPGMGRARALQTSLGAEVEAAIHDGAITAWFQPQIHARTGALSGMETLARWQHPKHGLLAPNEFLPAVAASGHMPLLGQTILHQAMKALQAWDADKAHVPKISINVSAVELRDPKMAAALSSEVARFGFAPDRVVIEIREDVATCVDDGAITANLQAIRDAGHQIDLDGFGLSAISLPTLQRYGVTRVKIDRSFILDVDVDSGKRQAASAVIAMAKAMEVETLANGVETPNEHDAMTALGCDVLQGFWIARPMTFAGVAEWARNHHAARKAIHLNDRRA